jgi:hypothetical protein
MLRAYCQVALLQNSAAKRIVGIALDASPRMTRRAGSSEDIMLMEVPERTDELIAETRDIQKKAEILLPSRLKPSFLREKTLTELDGDKRYSGNRSERRAARARERRRSR